VTTQQPKTMSKTEKFIEFVLDRTSKDNGARARLTRSLRPDGDIASDALWIIGGWLPDDDDKALIWARVAAMCAKYTKHPQRRGDEQTKTSAQSSLAGQLSAQSVNETSAERLLEHITRDGLTVSERLNHLARALEICPDRQRININWAWLIFDMERLSRGGDAALGVRRRWYRNYHRVRDVEPTNVGETPERKSHYG